MSAADQLTATETRLVEQYVRVLDHLSRCAQAVDTEDWFYLLDKARQLEYAAEQLTDAAQQLWTAVQAGRRPARGLLGVEVAWAARHYRAGRLLHPPEPTPKKVRGGEVAAARHPRRGRRGAAAAARRLPRAGPVPPLPRPAAQPAGPRLPRPRPRPAPARRHARRPRHAHGAP